MGKKRAADSVEGEDVGEDVQDANIAAPVTDAKVREIVVPRPYVAGDKYLKIISWNVNGLRSLVTTNKTVLLRLIANHKPDILCFQETKIQDNTIHDYDDLIEGYESYWNCSTVKKGYAGTAVFLKKSVIALTNGVIKSGSVPSEASGPPKKQPKLSALWGKKNIPEPEYSQSELSQGDEGVNAAGQAKLTKMLKVNYDFEDESKRFHGEGRTITVEFEHFIFVACYVPNSGEGLVRLDYRVNQWEPHMREYLKKLNTRKPVVYTGDLNCGHLDLDIHNPEAKHITKQAGLTPAERAAFTEMLTDTKFKDAFRHFHPDAKNQFTYWSVRAFNRPGNKGIRLDYFICSPDLFPAAEGGEGADSSVHVGAVGRGSTRAAEKGGNSAQENTSDTMSNSASQVQVYDSYILHGDTVGCSDHCPVVLILKL